MAATVRRADGTAVHVTVRRRLPPRDQVGHWVAPPSMREHPCPHRCCQNKRVHPANLPVKLDRKYLRGLNQEELERELEQYMRYQDTHETGYLQIIAEDRRRYESAERAEARKTRATERYRHRQEEWRDEVYRQWLQAENATNGNMLNKAGRLAGIDERTLFTGPESRVRKYASPELFEWFESHPRPTRASFLGSTQERRRHLAARRIGLEASAGQSTGHSCQETPRLRKGMRHRPAGLHGGVSRTRLGPSGLTAPSACRGEGCSATAAR